MAYPNNKNKIQKITIQTLLPIMSQAPKKLQTPPDLSNSHSTSNSNSIAFKRPGSGSVQDSLRFSYDFDSQSGLDYSEDGGKEIDFEFEEFPQYEFKGEMSIDNGNGNHNKKDQENLENESSMHRKIKMFEKYRQEEAKPQPKENIVDEFDQIFKMNQSKGMFKKKLGQPNQQTKQPQSQPSQKSQSNSSKSSLQNLNTNNSSISPATTVTTSIPTPTKNQTIPTEQSQSNIDLIVTPRSNIGRKDQKNASTILIIGGNSQTQLEKNSNDDFFQSPASTQSINIETSFDNTGDPFNMSQIGPEKKLIQDEKQFQNLNPRSTVQANSSFSPSNPSLNPNFQLRETPNPFSFNAQLKEQQMLNMKKQQSSQPMFVLTTSNKQIPLGGEATSGQLISGSGTHTATIGKKLSSPYPDYQPYQPQSNLRPTNPNSIISMLDVFNDNTQGQYINFINKPIPQPLLIQSSGSMPLIPPSSSTSFSSSATPSSIANFIAQTTTATKLSMPVFQEEVRIPPFMRKIRKMNSIYPNFNHPTINLENQAKFCNILASIFQEAFKYLEQVTSKALQRMKMPKYFPTQFGSLNYFTNSQWQKQRYRQWQMLNQTLRPRMNFARSEIDQSKIKSALSNYKEVIMYYKQRKIDLSSQQGIKTYFRIRQKFWSLQKNMRSISEDVYRMYQQSQYPNFYYEYLKILRAPLPAKNDEQLIRHHQQVLNTLLINRQRSEPLSCSEVGQAVKVKLERELKFLCPF